MQGVEIQFVSRMRMLPSLNEHVSICIKNYLHVYLYNLCAYVKFRQNYVFDM
jgi:hypothetical protein